MPRTKKVETGIEVVKVKPIVARDTEVASVEGFISQAIANNVPVETMERLLAMRKDLKAEQAHEFYIAAMAKFQSECPIIVKDTVVKDKYGKIRYNYATLDSIVRQVKEPLGRNGFSYSTDVKNADNMMTAVCRITHIMGHSETSTFEVPIDRDAYMSAPQKYAAASSFAKRYAFQNALGILTAEQDTDAADLAGGMAEEVAHPTACAPSKLDASNPVFASYKKQLESSKTLDELGKAWANMPIQAKTALNEIKEEMKAMITSEGGTVA